MQASKIKSAIAEVLKDEGYIKGYSNVGEGTTRALKVELRYVGKNERCQRHQAHQQARSPGLLQLVGYSACLRWPGRGDRVDLAWRDERRQARKQRIGGEVICHVW